MTQDDVTTDHVWQLFRDRLLAFFRARVGRDAEAEDLLQEVFLRIHSRLTTIRRRDRLESWVFQIARNVLTDSYRKSPRSTAAGNEELLDYAAKADSENLNEVVASCLRNMIDVLPSNYSQALRLYELDGIPQQEIADRLGLSLSGVKSRVQRGRTQLESILRACCDVELDQRGNVIEYQPVDARAECQGCRCGESVL